MTATPLITLTITATAYGGKGVARHDGKVYFVDNALEGDVVEATITEETSRYNTAVTQSIITPSPHRTPSPCQYSNQCGGCQWQGVPYETQLEWKKQFVLGSLQRIGKIDHLSCDMIGSPTLQQYRNRILLKARIRTDGTVVVGYFKRASRDLVEISTCLIASPRIQKFMAQLNLLRWENPPPREVKFRFEVQDLPIAQSDEPHLLVSIYDPDDKGFKVDHIAQIFRKISGVAAAESVRDSGKAHFHPFEVDLGFTFHTAAGLFQQVNVPHNHTLRRLVKDVVEKYNPSSILDIFCGSGNLSLALANGSRRIQGVEFSKRAIDCAVFNCQKNSTQNASYFAGDSEKFMLKAAKVGETYDLVIADPPREGMYQALAPLKNLKPKHLIYVSCDPTTLARDLASLCKKDYRIVDLKALDFFPNTYHIESFVVLERQGL